MAFNPLEQKGVPVDEQFRNWSELNVTPFDKHTVDPYTRTRVMFSRQPSTRSRCRRPSISNGRKTCAAK